MSTELLVLVLYFTLYFIAVRNINSAIFLYILLLPLRNLIGYHILGLFTPSIVFSFILIYHYFRLGYIHKLKRYYNNKTLKSLSIFTIVFVLMVYILTIRERILLKDYIGIDVSFMWVFNRTITSILQLINLLVLINIMFLNHQVRKIAYRALVLSSLIVVLSLYFAPLLDLIGINVREEFEKETSSFQDLGRVAGLYEGGDTNSVSVFLNLIIAIILVNQSIKRKNISTVLFAIIIFLVTGILITGSRMGFAILFVITIYYILFLNIKTHVLTANRIINFVFLVAAGLSVAYLIAKYDRFGLVFDRIEQQGLVKEVTTTGQRFIRWVGFIKHSTSDILRFFLGSNELFYAYGDFNYRDPHNLFVRILYVNGFIILTLFIWGFIKLLLLFKKLKLLPYSTLIILVIFTSMIIISQTNNINLFIIYTGVLIQEHLSLIKQ